MKREYTLYEMYLASVYKWGMLVLISACICADVVYTTMKLLGLYPTVSWGALIAFDVMDIIFAIIAFYNVKASIRNGYVEEKKLKEGKLFCFFVEVVQWNFILYMIPSRNFWGLFSFFLILICFFLDLKMILFLGSILLLSLFVAWFVNGNQLLPQRDELFLADQIFCIVVLLLILVGIIIFVYFMTHMQWLRKQDERHINMQSRYYQELLRKDEGMHRIRHDVKKHLYALDTLCRGGNLKDVQDYIAEVIQEVQEYTGIRTGNQIADCFLNMAIQELEKDGKIECEVLGRFPEIMNISNNDFCVLFANAVENAKEALEKIEGERKIELVIRNYQDKLYITLKNTAKSVGMEEQKKEFHGYGLKNMKLVVERYGGAIVWEQTENLFELNIMI